jgi:hypothetical protein
MEKEALWSRRVAAWERSGMSRKAWCAARGVNAHTFDYWRRRFGATPARAAKRRAGTTLVPVMVQPEHAVALPQAAIEMVYGDVALRLSPTVDASWLARLVRELRGC